MMKIKKLVVSYWLIPLFLVVIFLRLPSLFEPFTYGDEGIYLTLGLAVRKGLTLYRDIHDNKPPMLYLLAALAGNFAYFRALLFVWSLVTIYVFWRLAEKIFSKNQKAVIIATFAFAILTSIHTFEGNIANAENFMLLPILVGILVILRGLDEHGSASWRTDLHRFFFAGTLFSLATLFKVPAAFDFLAVLIFLIFVLFKTGKFNILRIAYCVLPFSIGFLLPVLATILYYASKGALNQYLHAAFLQNIPYLTSWGTGSHIQFSLLRSGLFLKGIFLLVACCLLLVASKKFSQNFLLVALWFFFSLFAALLSSRPYPHYLIQVLPSLSLLLGFLNLGVRKEKLFAFACFSLFAFSFYFYKFWYYPNISYYKNFYQYTLGLKSKEQYFADFDPRANDIYQTADFTINHSLLEEKIFIWGNEPFIYALSRRLPPGRYTTAYHIIDFGGWCETIKAIVKERVKLVIMASIDREFPAIKALLEQKYIKIGEVGEYRFYRRIVSE